MIGSTNTPIGSRSNAVAVGAAATALFLIGTSAAASAELSNYSVFGSQTLRYLIASVLLLTALAVRTRGRLPRLSMRDLGRLILLATLGFAGFNLGLINATKSADPALVGTVLAATPVVLAVLGPLQRLHRPQLQTVVGGLIVAGGTALASGLGHTDLAGIVWSLVALASEVAFSLLAVPLIRRYGSFAVTTYAGAASVPVMLGAGLIVEGPAQLFRPMTGHELLALGYVALVVAVLANTLWYGALSRLAAERAGLFYAFTPVGALVGGLVIGRSELSTGLLLGLVGVAIGLVVGLWRPRHPRVAQTVEDWGTRHRARGRRGGQHDGADPAVVADHPSTCPEADQLAAVPAQHGGGARVADLDAGRSARS